MYTMPRLEAEEENSWLNHPPKKFCKICLTFLHLIQAILNPLQAVLNTLVYKGFAGGICKNRQNPENVRVNSREEPLMSNEFARSFSYSTENETSPLLYFRK
jgi:hypothetical protein